MKKYNILVIDDEEIVRNSMKEWLEQGGYGVYLASDGEEALRLVKEKKLNIIIVDLKLPGMDGMGVFREAKKINPNIYAIFITAYGTVESAVIAMKEGAYDFIEKPFCPERIELLIKKIIEHYNLTQENIALKERLQKRYKFEDIIGKSNKMQKVFELIKTVSKSNVIVLIQGETGTGKELVARAIHNISTRCDKPFIPVSCSALPESLLETELFGYEKGAFTDAKQCKLGKFEIANKGTLFLDEIGDISQNIQMHLLRVIEEKELTRVGGNEIVKVDIRIISATNKNLEEEVKKGNFREDLFYRLNVIIINLPPLRGRKEDILLLAEHFLNKFSKENNKKIEGFSQEVIEFLLKYDYLGNVRELENIIEHAVIICNNDIIKVEHLPVPSKKEEMPLSTNKLLREVEKAHILSVLKEVDYNLTKAAKLLGITRATLYNKIRTYNLQL